MKPPSPCTGSSTTQATLCGVDVGLEADAPSASIDDRRAVDLGRERAEAALVGHDLQVSDIVSSVRPWNARSKATTAGRPVAARAILTAFSTASAPEFSSTLL